MQVAFFCSRNKDNIGIENFKQRYAQMFVENEDDPRMWREFYKFAQAGFPRELSRLYISVNRRDMVKTKKDLICYLVEHDEAHLDGIESLATKLAMKPENALEHKWLFDFDDPREELCDQFCEEIKQLGAGNVTPYRTRSNWCVVCDKHFDYREILQRYKENEIEIELKKDSELYLGSASCPV